MQSWELGGMEYISKGFPWSPIVTLEEKASTQFMQSHVNSHSCKAHFMLQRNWWEHTEVPPMVGKNPAWPISALQQHMSNTTEATSQEEYHRGIYTDATKQEQHNNDNKTGTTRQGHPSTKQEQPNWSNKTGATIQEQPNRINQTGATQKHNKTGATNEEQRDRSCKKHT